MSTRRAAPRARGRAGVARWWWLAAVTVALVLGIPGAASAGGTGAHATAEDGRAPTATVAAPTGDTVLPVTRGDAVGLLVVATVAVAVGTVFYAARRRAATA